MIESEEVGAADTDGALPIKGGALAVDMLVSTGSGGKWHRCSCW
jgi:hypothetical protein